MVKKLIISVSAFVLVIIIAGFNLLSSSGHAGATGAPSEGTCASCHGGGSSLASSVFINAVPDFTGSTYVPGETYTISVVVNAMGFNNFGFGCVMLNSSNANAGTMQNPGAGVKLVNGAFGRKNAVHTAPKNGSETTTFSFEWVAPSTGDVNVYVGANAVNNNGSTSGDLPFSSTLTLTSPLVSSVKEHAVALTSLNIFPNPTSEDIQIRYFLAESRELTISLFDLQGKQMAELWSGKQESGMNTHSLKVPSYIESGVYFVKLYATDEMLSSRIITVK